MKKAELVSLTGLLGVGCPIVVTKCAKDCVQSSEKENKKADYDQARNCWFDFRGYRCVDQMDASDGTVADFLIGPHEAGVAPNTILLALVLVRSDSRKQGLDLTGEIGRKTIGNIRQEGRSHGRGLAKGAGIESVHLASRKLASDSSPRSLRDAVIPLVTSDAILRGSKLLELRVGGITEQSDKSGRVELNFITKTIANGDDIQYMRASTMRIVDGYIKIAGLTEDDKLVICIDCWDRPGSRDMSIGALNKIVRRLGRAHFGEHLSSHSFRVGSAQSLLGKGANVPELQPFGTGNLQRCRRTTVGKSLTDKMQWQSTSMDSLVMPRRALLC